MINDLTLADIAKQLNCSTAVLRHHIKKGTLAATKKGKTWFVTPEDFETFKGNKAAHTPGVKKAEPTQAEREQELRAIANQAQAVPIAERNADVEFDSPAWQAKRKLEYMKELNRRGSASYEQVCEAADAYIAEIAKWAKSKGRKVKLPSRASLTR